jgi:predicted regulator of Ras-like GTPase activity (Roadblock/LC7/MglB family)
VDYLTDLIDEIKVIQGVKSLVITDDSGTPMDFPGVEEDDESAAVTAFVGNGINSLADKLDLDDFKSMSMAYEGGSMIVCPIGELYVGIMLSVTRNLFKIESKINDILG